MSCTCPQFDCMEHGAQAKNLMTPLSLSAELLAALEGLTEAEAGKRYMSDEVVAK